MVLDVVTGDVMAMVSTPGFDPNTFARGITQSEWRELLESPERPLHNKAIAGVYPPGSTYKMVTALAALESKAIDPWTRLPCVGYPRARQHQVPLLAEGRPRLDQRRRGDRPVLRLLLLRGRAPRRHRPHRRCRRAGWASAGMSELGLPGESAGIQPQPRLEAGEARQALAARRHVQPRHRPGLHELPRRCSSPS